MVSTLIVRPAAPGDLSDMVELLVQLGYPARREVLCGVLDALLGDPRHVVLVAEHPGDGVVAMIALSSRPVLRLQGWLGTIEELVVKRGMRDRGIGDRMVQHAKGLATERGWTRLETAVSRTRESNRRGSLGHARGTTASSLGAGATLRDGLAAHAMEVAPQPARKAVTPSRRWPVSPNIYAAVIGL